MTKKLEEKLRKDFPKIFKTCKWNYCEDGWFSIIYSLCEILQSYVDNHPKARQVEAVEIKEKFGRLRFYYEGGDDNTDKYVEAVCSMSKYVCELCGVMNVLDVKERFFKNGRIITLCEKCDCYLLLKENKDDTTMYVEGV